MKVSLIYDGAENFRPEESAMSAVYPDSKSEAETPADIITPHDEPNRFAVEKPEPELPQGIVDPRLLPGPEILMPASPGLLMPTTHPLKPAENGKS